ncbi:MAG: SHOCT domain-containing protein [Ruminococcaceae bacterium]|nr:SHOCT domain-containing protein [Oscillospiraceae bacterium]
MLNEGGWKCSCGKVQASYVSSCSCGKSKQEVLYPQTNKKQEETKKSANANEISNAAAIKEYKELMDAGIISPEEFDAKKKQLLGL